MRVYAYCLLLPRMWLLMYVDYIKANTTKKVKTVEVSNITTTVQQQQTLNNDGTEAEAVTEVVIEEEEDDDYGDAMSRLFG